MRIDINSDVGEGFGQWPGGPDEALFGIISSANVACGFHAGDPTIMRRTCQLAVDHNVTIGAHVSYPDLVGFGRRFIDIEPTDLRNAVVYQIGALHAMASSVGAAVSYVKPHGALYNTIAQHVAQAEAVMQGVADAQRAVGASLPILGLADTCAQQVALDHGLAFVPEGFADRGYQDNGLLIPRGQPGALLATQDAVSTQVLRLAARGLATICIHSDSPGATEIARWTHSALTEHGYDIRSFLHT